MTRIENKYVKPESNRIKIIESNQIKTKIESNQTETTIESNQIDNRELKGSKIATRKTADADDGDHSG